MNPCCVLSGAQWERRLNHHRVGLAKPGPVVTVCPRRSGFSWGVKLAVAGVGQDGLGASAESAYFTADFAKLKGGFFVCVFVCMCACACACVLGGRAGL